jgi:hypothetical protein
MIRFVKFLEREHLEKFKGQVPAHSCVLESYDLDSSQIYKENTDKVHSLPMRLIWNEVVASSVIEFIMSVHERKTSNTTFYCEDYTVAKFVSDMLRIQKGRFTGESGVKEVEPEKYFLLELAYKGYVLEGVVA